MFGLGTTELIVIGVIIFLIFGVKRLPDIGKGLGGAVREFRKIKSDLGSKKEQPDKDGDGSDEKGRKETNLPANRLAKKIIEQAPGLKKVSDIKKKAEKIKRIID